MTHQRSALVVRGGWDGHQPVETTDLFIPFLREHGFDVRVEESPAIYADADYMASVDLIMQCVTMSEIAQDEVKGLMAAVAAGTGLAGWHGGIADSYRACSDYLLLVGGQFAQHPPRGTADTLVGDETDNFLRYAVNIRADRADHPIVAGLSDFELTTEQYWVLTDDYNDVLATTTLASRDFDAWHAPSTSPAVWTRAWGEGKVFVCTPGHQVSVLENPNVRTIVERGLLWASR